VPDIATPYKQFQAGEQFDAIVIGSGLGGLASAALLARHGGRRVLVLERHYTAGGFTHAFKRPGYEWDVGLHYVGDMGPRGMTRRLFDHVSGGRVEWAPMGEVYDRIVVGKTSFDFPAGRDAFRERLHGYFPGEARVIDRYLGLLRKVPRRAGAYFAEKAVPAPVAAVLGGLMRAPFLRHARRTTRSVLEGLGASRELAGVLTGQWGDYGLPPGRSSFGMHAILARHYLLGGFYPVGGASRIAAGVAPAIEERGGSIVVGAEVREILVEGGRTRGVRLADGAEIPCPLVISDAGAHNTLGRLIPSAETERLGVVRRIERLRASVAHACLYLGFKRTAEDLGLAKANLWLYPGFDHDANVEAHGRDPEAPLPVVYASFPSAKDPSFQERFPGRATVELITLASFDGFAAWKDQPWRRRGEEYEALKERLAERMLDRLEEQVPGLRDRIDFSEVSTPLSTRTFAGYEKGEIYGIEHSPQRFLERSLRPRTPIRGLFLTGQDVASCGIAGALVGGFLTASAVLGRNLLSKAARS
jgi:all-trans-retinol 13,14-reductase